MASNSIITKADVSELRSNISTMVKSLKQLERNVQNINKQSKSLDEGLGNSTALKNFVNSLKDADKEAVKSFSSIARGIDDLSRGVERLSKIQAVDLEAVFNIKGGGKNTAESISNFIKGVNKSSKNIDFENLDRIRKFFESFEKVSKSTANLAALEQGGGIGIVDASLSEIFSGLKAIEASTQGFNIDKVDQISKIMQRVTRSIQNVLDGFISLTDIESSRGRALKAYNFAFYQEFFVEVQKVFNVFKQGFEVIEKAASKINTTQAAKIDGLVKSFSVVGKSVLGLTEAFSVLKVIEDNRDKSFNWKFWQKNFEEIDLVFDVFKQGLTRLELAVRNFNSVEIAGISKITNSVTSVGKGITDIISAFAELDAIRQGRGRGGQVVNFIAFQDGFDQYFKEINLVLNVVEQVSAGLSRAARTTGDVKGVAQLTGAISTLGTGMKALLQFGEQLGTFISGGRSLLDPAIFQPARLDVIGNIARAVNLIALELKRIATRIPNIKNIASLARSLSDLGSGVDAIFDFAKRLGPFLTLGATLIPRAIRTGDIANFFRFVSTLAEETANIAAEIQNVSDVSALSGSLGSLANGVEAIFNFGERLPVFRLFEFIKSFARLDRVSNVFKFIVPFVRRLSTLAKEIDNLSDVSKLSSALRNLSRGIEDIYIFATSLPQKGITTAIKNFFFGDEITRFLGLVQRVADGVSKISSQIDNLKDVSKLSSALKNLSGAIKDLQQFGASIPRGFRATIRRFVGLDAIGKSLKEIERVAEAVGKINKNVNESGSTIKDLGKFLKDFAEFVNDPELQKIDKAKTRKVAENIKTLAEAFKPLRNVELPDLRKLSANIAGSGGRGGRGTGGTPAISDALEAEFGVGKFNNKLSQIRRGYNEALGAFLFELKGAFSNAAIDATQILAQPFKFAARELGKFAREGGAQIRQFGQEVLDIGQQISEKFSIGRIIESTGFDAAATFDQLSSQLSTFGGAAFPLEDAQAFANQIGIDFPLSANEALQAILDLTKAGQDFGSIQDVLPNAANLASLETDLGLENATGVLITAVNSFDRATEEFAGSFANAEVFANLISGASDASTASITSLQAGLENVAASANAANLTFEDTVSFLALFNDRGIQGAEAGTALRSVLDALARPAAREELDRLRVSLFDASGAARPLNDVINDLRVALEGYSDEQRTASLSKLADTFGRQNLNILLASEGIEGYTEAINGVAPASERAQALLDNFRGQVQQLQGSLETLLTKAFVPLLNRAFLPVVRIGRDVVDFLIKLPQPVIDTAVNIVTFTLAIGTAVGALVTAVGALGIFGGAVVQAVGFVLTFIGSAGAMIAALGSVAAAVGVGTAALALLVPGIVIASNVVTKFFRLLEDDSSAVGTAFEELVTSAREVIGSIVTIFTSAGSIIGDLFNEVLGFDKNFEVTLLERIKTIRQSLVGFASAVVNPLRDVVEGTSTFIKILQGEDLPLERLLRFEEIIESLLDVQLIQDIFKGDADVNDVLRLFQLIRDTAASIISDFAQIGGGIIDLILGNDRAIQRIQSGIAGIFTTLLGNIQAFTGFDLSEALFQFESGKLAAGVSALVQSVFKLLKDEVLGGADGLEDILSAAIQRINPLNGVELIFRLLGFDNLAGQISEINEKLAVALEPVLRSLAEILTGRNLNLVIFDNFGEQAFVLFTRLRIAFNDLQALSIQVRNAFLLTFAIFTDPEVRESSGIFGTIAERIGSIVAYLSELPLDTIAAFKDGLDSIADGFKKFLTEFGEDPQRVITETGVVIGTLSAVTIPGLIAGFGGVLPLLGALKGGFLALGGSIYAVVGPAAAFIAIFFLLKSAFENLDTLLVDRDPFGFLLATLRDLGLSVLELGARVLGLEDSFDTFSERAMATSQQFALWWQVFFVDRIVNAFNTALTSIVANFQFQVNRLIETARRLPGVQLELIDVVGETGSEIVQQIDNLDDAIARSEFFKGINADELGFFDTGVLRSKRTEVSALIQETLADYDSLAEIDDSTFEGILVTLDELNDLDNFLLNQAGDLETYFSTLERISQIRPDLLEGAALAPQFATVIGDRVRQVEDEELRLEMENVIVSLRNDGIISNATAEQVIDPIVDGLEDASADLSIDLESTESIQQYLDKYRELEAEVGGGVPPTFMQYLDSVGTEAGLTEEELQKLLTTAQQVVDAQGSIEDTGFELASSTTSAGGTGLGIAKAAEEEKNEAQEQYNEALDDLNEFVRKSQTERQKDLKREQDQIGKIQDIREKFDSERDKAEEEFNLDTQRREEDHRKKMQEIQEKANLDIEDELIDAAITRDAAAAQRAIESRNQARAEAEKEAQEEQANFQLEEQRRREDFARQQADRAAQAAERQKDAVARLEEIRQENRLKAEERAFELDKLKQELSQKQQVAAGGAKAVIEAEAQIAEARLRNAEREAQIAEARARQDEEREKALAYAENELNVSRQQALDAEQQAVAALTAGINQLPGSITNLFGSFSQGLEQFSAAGGNLFTGLSNAFNGALRGASGGLFGGSSRGSGFQIARKNANGSYSGGVPEFNTGGIVERSGLAFVDKDELILNERGRDALRLLMANASNGRMARAGAGGMGNIVVQNDFSGMNVPDGVNTEQLATRISDMVLDDLTSIIDRVNRG